MPECAVVFELTPFAEGLTFLVVAKLTVAIESIDGPTKPTWMSLINLAFGHAKYPVVVECAILTWISVAIEALFEAPELDKSRETSEALLDVIE